MTTASTAPAAPTAPSVSDRIERSTVINAGRERVWRALTEAERFGTWFGANLAAQEFKPGARVRGNITIPGFTHVMFDAVFQRIEPQDLVSFNWHPYAVEPGVDYDSEEPTLVTFTLEDAPNNATLLTVVESGFDKVPAHRRAQAFQMNSGGWEGQLRNIVRYVTQ